jgi:hypothetical protein
MSNIKNILPWYISDILTKFGLTVDDIYCDSGAYVDSGIYIGSLTTAMSESRLNQLNIGAIINLSQRKYNCKLPVFDIDMDDAAIDVDNFEDYVLKFKSGIDAIKSLREKNKNVLVHCAAGINRSATLIAMYLIDLGDDYNTAVSKLVIANSSRGVPLLTNQTFKYLLSAQDSFNRNFNCKQLI